VYTKIEKLLVADSQANATADGGGMVNVQSMGPRNAGDLQYTPTASTSASDLMFRFCNRLQLSPAIQATCVRTQWRMLGLWRAEVPLVLLQQAFSLLVA